MDDDAVVFDARATNSVIIWRPRNGLGRVSMLGASVAGMNGAADMRHFATIFGFYGNVMLQSGARTPLTGQRLPLYR